MHKLRFKSAIAAGSLAAAVGISLLGAGTAAASTAASPLKPRQSVVFGSLGDCLTYGNRFAQLGTLTTYSCTPLGGGSYLFNYTD
ncbi:hypothetical protein ACH4GE_36245 [Streptomyces tendae]|uniref:hypothetical protein n=1 Tax=Streptomyces tendae TaxID=1932 RepID=UPI0037A03785